jgi:tripartite-type tricarboxylate transporter receptor subunit TctC
MRIRKAAIRAALAACASLCVMPSAQAQSRYPEKPVRLVVPFAPGGGTDILARVIAPKVGEGLGQTLLVENRAGAGGNIGTDLVAKAPPDGYTVLLGSNTIAINAGLAKLPFDPVNDLAAVTLVANAPMVLVVHPSVSARTVKEFVAAAKASPGKLNYAAAGNGTPQHLASELLNRLAGIDVTHVQYKGGGPALADVIAGNTQAAVLTMAAVKPHLAAGKLRALGVATAKRSPAMRDLPTIAEAGVAGYEADLWYGIFAPAGTPRAAIDRLAGAFAQALQSAEIQERLAVQGFDLASSTPEQLATMHRNDVAKYGKLIRDAGIKPE